MPNITAYQENLPDILKDFSAYVVCRVKLTAVRAEMRAIEKLELAEEVRRQKREEARMLGEALLDAEVRIGELTKRIPKSVGGRPEKILDTAVQNFESRSNTAVTSEKVQYYRKQQLLE